LFGGAVKRTSFAVDRGGDTLVEWI